MNTEASLLKPPGLRYLPFVKMQGTGNDFMVVDAVTHALDLDWPRLAQETADRHFGVGHDGLLVITRDPASGRLRMRMYNPDGTEDMCGNGLRCVARYAVERGLSPQRSLVIDTLSGPRVVEVLADGRVSVQMGPVPFVRSGTVETPAGRFAYVLLHPGTPHAVLLQTELPGDELFLAAGPAIEHSPEFAERVSVMWAVPQGPHLLCLRIWERSVGETLGCGTGACAAAVAAVQAGAVEEPVTVRSKGGDLVITRDPAALDSVIMTGPAELIYEGRYPLSESFMR